MSRFSKWVNYHKSSLRGLLIIAIISLFFSMAGMVIILSLYQWGKV